MSGKESHNSEEKKVNVDLEAEEIPLDTMTAREAKKYFAVLVGERTRETQSAVILDSKSRRVRMTW